MVAHRKHGDGTRAFPMFPGAKISFRKQKIRNNCYAGENLCWNPPAKHEKGAPARGIRVHEPGAHVFPVCSTGRNHLRISPMQIVSFPLRHACNP